MNATRWLGLFALLGLLAGCGVSSTQSIPAPKPTGSAKSEEQDPEAKIQQALAKLSPEDRKAAEEQRFCPIADDSRLGSMGAPVKVTLKERTVFLCCASCKKQAERHPDRTLARVDALKAKGTAPEEREKATEPREK
jgi:hypothetical protein